MPVQYTSIVSEHQATRSSVGLFDISHMGRVFLQGNGVAGFLERLLTRKTSNLLPGRIRYSLICNEDGGILDDVLIYRLTDDQYLLVVNAGNRLKILAWIEQHRPAEVTIEDRTAETAMIAVQGPLSASACNPLCDMNVTELKYYTGSQCTIGGQQAIVSRTGYTGEDGWELIVPAANATAIWEQLAATDLGENRRPTAVGLGARDTLRLEAAMPLYGHELSEEITPIEADLKFAVNLADRDFFGRDKLVDIIERGPDRLRVGLELLGRRIAREHYPILFDDVVVGEVTSGTLAPTLQRPIAMGYVQSGLAKEGQPLSVDIRGRQEAAKVVPLPFYRRTK